MRPIPKKPEHPDDDPERGPGSRDLYLLIGIIIIVAIFAIGIILARSSQNQGVASITKEFKGFKFEKVGDVWVTLLKVQYGSTAKTYQILVHYTPDEVSGIETMKNSRNESVTPNLFLNVKNVYITTEPDYPAEVVLSGVEIAKIIGQVYEKEVRSALTRPDNRSASPVITCGNTSSEIRVIYLKLGNSTKIYSDFGCIVVQGTDPVELLKASERLTFEMLKIL